MWDYTPTSWSTTTRDFQYPAENKTVSQYVFFFNVKRPISGGIRRLLPPAFILFTVLISFSIPVSNSIGRLGNFEA
jgi:hypothetical protein